MIKEFRIHCLGQRCLWKPDKSVHFPNLFPTAAEYELEAFQTQEEQCIAMAALTASRGTALRKAAASL